MAAAPDRQSRRMPCLLRYPSFSGPILLPSFFFHLFFKELLSRFRGGREGFFRPFHSSCTLDILYFRLVFSVPNLRHP